MSRRPYIAGTTRLLAALLALFALAICGFPAFAQGFMVKPMRMEATARAGKTIEVPLEIRNTGGSDIRAIDLRLAEISQNIDGSWRLIEQASAEDASRRSSSVSWTTLSSNRAEIEPLQPAQIMVRLSPPADARGAYFAAIIAETPVPQGTTGLVVRVRFVIPLIIQIEGRPARQQVSLQGVVMTYHDGSDGKSATTTAALRVSNDGRTYSHVSGHLTIERKNQDKWRPVTRFDIKERAIMPGLDFELGEDIERRLPSGAYRLRGELMVDGRRVPPVEKEIDFKGDPKADTLAYDTALILTPDLVDMDIVPGATRTTILHIENPGADPVNVKMEVATPKGLIGVAMGDLLGISLSAEPWTQIVPSQFTIRPGLRQNVRVMSRVPKAGVDHPNYYGDLILSGTYADGQSAGETRSTVHLSYAEIQSEPKGNVEQIDLSEGDKAGDYFVQVRLANTGNVHIAPSARVYLLSPQGEQLRNVELSGETGPLLPLGKRSFSAELNLENVKAGYYALRASITLAPGKDVAGQQILKVETEETAGDDGKTALVQRITLVDPGSADLPEGIDLRMGHGPIVPLAAPDQPEAGDAG